MKAIDNPIATIMTDHVVVLDINNDDLAHAELLFKKHKIRHLPVVDNGILVGMLSLTDLQRLSFVNKFGAEELDVDTAIYEMLSVPQVMVAKPVTIDASRTIREAAELLATHEFHALPVVSKKRLVGIVTSTDMIRFLLAQ